MIHFHIQLSKRGQTPSLEYRTNYLLNAKEKMKDLLRNHLICTKPHNYHDVKCYAFDVPMLSAKIAHNHSVYGHTVDHIEVFDCDEVKCYKKHKV